MVRAPQHSASHGMQGALKPGSTLQLWLRLLILLSTLLASLIVIPSKSGLMKIISNLFRLWFSEYIYIFLKDFFLLKLWRKSIRYILEVQLGSWKVIQIFFNFSLFHLSSSISVPYTSPLYVFIIESWTINFLHRWPFCKHSIISDVNWFFNFAIPLIISSQ